MRGLASLLFLVGTTTIANAQQIELKNDGFTSGELVAFHGGFAAGDIGASRFLAPSAGRQLLRVQFLFGDDSTMTMTTQTITLHVWDDTAGMNGNCSTLNSAPPGAELYSGDFMVTESEVAFHEIDLTADNIIVPAQFRVGIEVTHNGPPSIANDTGDGLDPNRNFIDEVTVGWWRSNCFGVSGDWIIRAYVSDTGMMGTPDANPGGGPDADPSAPDADPSAPDAAMGGACSGNTECPFGQYCDLMRMTCTFDCRSNADCGGDTCNSLGQCVMGEGGGCCQTGDGGAGQALVFAAGGAFLLRRRRRPAA